MDKIWYLLLGGKKQGPFSVQQLDRDKRITPDTLAWKEGMDVWLPIRDIEELASVLFAEPRKQAPVQEEEEAKSACKEKNGALTLQLSYDPVPFLWLILLLILLLCYFFYYFFG